MLDLGGEWQLAVDPDNVGREQGWCRGPEGAGEVRAAPVPGTIQQVFPGYHGVAWYWRTFALPETPLVHPRWLLRFGAVDYLAQVWLNGVEVGGHENGETPFTLDVSTTVREGENLLAVRVLNPTHARIDGVTLNETPHRNREIPFRAGASYNHGGIVQGVALESVPPVWVSDLFAIPEPQTGVLALQVTVTNADTGPAPGRLSALVAPAAGGASVAAANQEFTMLPGEATTTLRLRVPDCHLWSLDDPYLYRATVVLQAEAGGAPCWHDASVRFGFREFVFREGYFRLNGKRLFLRGSHTGNHYPINVQNPPDRELLRRDIYFAKAMGFNMIRFIAGLALPEQLDLCDEIGLLVYEESLAGWCLADSPQMRARFDRAVAEMIRRDRNHPSVAIWGLLNETPDGPVFRHAVETLPLVRSLDATRLVLLGSGRWDCDLGIGSVSNPGSAEWEPLLGGEAPGAGKRKMSGPGGYAEQAGDAHAYPRVPHSAETIAWLRTVGEGTKHVFLSEYGIGSQVDPVRTAAWYEQEGASPDLEDYRLNREWADRLHADWPRLGMDRIWASPADFFAEGGRLHARQRTLGLNAIRANPNLCGHSLTGTVDQGMTGEGLWTAWRELKPEIVETMRAAWAPLRLCVFAEPLHLYPGGTVRVEAVLANEDALAPGEYGFCLRVLGPGLRPVLERRETVCIPAGGEQPFAVPVCAESLAVEEPGRYRVLAELDGAAPTGGEAWFEVHAPVRLEGMQPLALWGETGGPGPWLERLAIRWQPWGPESRTPVILVAPGGPLEQAAWERLLAQVEAGATAIVLSPEVLASGDDPLGRLPGAGRGRLLGLGGWLYHRHDFARQHPIFAGLPAGGLLDLEYYREIIPDQVLADQEGETVAGGMAIGYTCPGGYGAGGLVTIRPQGRGRLVLSTLRLLENAGHPVADRLLANMVAWADGRIGE